MTTVPDPTSVHWPDIQKINTAFPKPLVTSPKIEVGEFTYYNDADDPIPFETRNVPYTSGPELLDRLPERAALGRLLDGARAGRSGVLVLRGEPGVGKTVLLEWAVESATGLRVARVAGVESEIELAFAALQQLCAPMLDRLESLPDPQR
jgi:hypothetical protein